jgi:hypothetical protein
MAIEVKQTIKTKTFMKMYDNINMESTAARKVNARINLL